MDGSSGISGFYKLSSAERLLKVAELTGLSEEECGALSAHGALGLEQADKMVENVIGSMEIPLGIAVNFKVNGKDYLVPMATEEPSVIAAASNAAKLARGSGGFSAETTGCVMRGQIQVVGSPDAESAKQKLLDKKGEILEMANQKDPMLVKYGGGAKDLEVHVIESQVVGRMLSIHLLVDCRDAMGANAVNTMAEAVAPAIVEITGGHARLKIISNLADLRLARAKAVFLKESLGGEEVVDAIIESYELAANDKYRASTHNKGIMNGITAVVLATGNDTRAVEAGAHSYAATNGSYKPLAKYWKNENGDLEASVELPMAVGLVGGATRVHPVAKAAVKILGVKTASELSQVIASVGLAQNFAALRALSTEGIQRGHMALHSRNIAITAGATGGEVGAVSAKMVEEKDVRMERAKEILEDLRNKD
ncbi:MAG: hydroxymethylglutaryl-CoA reductase, degradative [Candidatus Diapherotrites archaeon]|nr:hydroxymethylglutaryl-CoA reductase, degradative [Candidatus Diapherotrites archaeon]